MLIYIFTFQTRLMNQNQSKNNEIGSNNYKGSIDCLLKVCTQKYVVFTNNIFVIIFFRLSNMKGFLHFTKVSFPHLSEWDHGI